MKMGPNLPFQIPVKYFILYGRGVDLSDDLTKFLVTHSDGLICSLDNFDALTSLACKRLYQAEM